MGHTGSAECIWAARLILSTSPFSYLSKSPRKNDTKHEALLEM